MPWDVLIPLVLKVLELLLRYLSERPTEGPPPLEPERELSVVNHANRLHALLDRRRAPGT